MINWQAAERSPPLGRKRGRLRSVLGRPLLLVGILLIGLILIWTVVQERRLRADIIETVRWEEHLLRLGTREQLDELADPAAPAEWLERYGRLPGQIEPHAPLPTLVAIEHQSDRAIASLRYDRAQWSWRERRAYRWVAGRWRRTPIDSSSTMPAHSTVRGRYLLLQGARQDLHAIDREVDLEEMDRLRQQFLERWPESCADCSLMVTVRPLDLQPLPYRIVEQENFRRGSRMGREIEIVPPTFFRPDTDSSLPAPQQYRLALATALLEGLTPGPPSSREGQAQEWWALFRLLQQAEARQRVLDEAARRELRNEWRRQLEYRWHSPFDGPLPPDLTVASQAERRRWMAASLIVERWLLLGGEGSAASLARILLQYQPEHFDPRTFFLGIIGGSEADLEQLFRDYLITPEP